MILKCQTFDYLTESIRSEKLSIVMFGCGVIGRIVTPEILFHYGLLDRIVCFADNDRTLWGTYIELYGKAILVVDPDTLRERQNIVILLNISRYDGVLEQLNHYKELTSVSCYLMPMLCIHNFAMPPETKGRTDKDLSYTADDPAHEGQSGEGNRGSDNFLTTMEKSGKVILEKEETPVIPKILNYIWIGGTPLPESLERCIKSWKKFCPDYEIRRWDESNYDFHAIPYMAEAYDRKAFGFAPDYARLDILYRYGGFYLDTDVELIKPLDDLCFQEAFCGVEKWQVLNPGGLSGAVAGNEMIKAMRDSRISEHFVNVDGSENRISSGYFDTKAALEHGYRINGKLQRIDGMTVYPSDFFHPYDYMSGRTIITENTYSIHHFGGSWLTPEMEESNRRTRESYQALYEEALRNGE